MLDSVVSRTAAPSEFEDLQRAVREGADLARSVATTEQARAMPPEFVEMLKKTELLRSGVPRDLGGLEAPPAVSLEAAEAVARGDASAGWCVSIAVTSSLLSAYASRKSAEEVFGDPMTVATGVWAPRGKSRRVDGGVVLSGQWVFCSGIPHAEWLFAGFVLDKDLRVAAIPKAELDVLDTWHTNGLRGTGSHDCVATDVFVPDHRAFYQTSPLERRFRDAHAATAHFQVNPASYELPGKLLLGRPAQTGQL